MTAREVPCGRAAEYPSAFAAMNFSCSRCHRTFQTTDEAVPGRVYRVPCKCGNTIVVEVAEPTVEVGLPAALHRLSHTPLPGIPRAGQSAASTGPGSPTVGGSGPEPTAPLPPQRAPDDPFARPLADEQRDVTPTVLPDGLALRDPDAGPDEATGLGLTGAASFDDLLVRVRRRAFLAGACAGALGAVAVAVAIALVTRLQSPQAPAPAPGAPRELARAPEPPPTPPPAPPARQPAVAPPVARAPAVPAAPRPAPPPPAPRASAAPDVVAAAPPPAAPARPPVERRPAPSPPPAPSERAAPAGEPAPEAHAASDAAPDAPDRSEPADPEPRSTARVAQERQVTAAIQARRAALEGCFADPEDAAVARGQRFHLVVIVAPSGQVTDARADDPDIDSSPAGACLSRIAHGLSLDAFEGDPVRVDVPLRFGKGE